LSNPSQRLNGKSCLTIYLKLSKVFQHSAQLCLFLWFIVVSHSSYANGGSESDNPATDWILGNFQTTPIVSGQLDGRKTIEMPALVHNVNHTGAGKNAFQLRSSALNSNYAGFINVSISGLYRDNSPTGAGIATSRDDDNVGTVLFLSNVDIAPGWPDFISYDEANFDGIVLDGAQAIYGQDVTISDVNSDAAIDNKALLSQFVRLNISGDANRSIRYWNNGPHYLVDSTIDNSGGAGAGTLIWIKNCATTELRVFNSSFNGAATIPLDKIECENNSGTPQISYLTNDPRSLMHPMFGGAKSLNSIFPFLFDDD